MNTIKKILMCLISFSSGTIVSASVLAFIAALNIVSRLADRTNTTKYIRVYEVVISIAGFIASFYGFISIYIPIPAWFICIYSFALGIFVGCLAISLVEILNVIPIFAKRFNVKKGLSYFMFSIAIGKCLGALIHLSFNKFNF